jgi:threonine/homoserine/homoserine lactone efflux protein
MHLSVSLPAFVVAVLLISASPGPAMALILRWTALHGMRTAVPLVLGLELGLYLWALAAAAGFAALVAASEAAYWALKIVGACVLVHLGLRAWLAAWRERGASHVEAPVDDHSPGALKAFAEGLVVQLANPKAAVFMIAFYPQFVPSSEPLFRTTAVLALLQVSIELCFYLTLAAFVARAGASLRRSTVRRRLEAVSGTVLVGLGLRVAVSSR